MSFAQRIQQNPGALVVLGLGLNRRGTGPDLAQSFVA